MANNIVQLRTDKDVQFTGAIVQNAAENEDIVLSFAQADATFVVAGIEVLSKENLAWELAFWAKDTFTSTNADLEYYLGNWQFQAADGFRIGGTGLYRYSIPDLNIPIYDADNTAEMHVALINRSAASKTAGAAGEIVVVFNLEAQQAGGA